MYIERNQNKRAGKYVIIYTLTLPYAIYVILYITN